MTSSHNLKVIFHSDVPKNPTVHCAFVEHSELEIQNRYVKKRIFCTDPLFTGGVLFSLASKNLYNESKYVFRKLHDTGDKTFRSRAVSLNFRDVR